MKILHYILGFPPCRSGGMTRYAYDLMQEQLLDGNSVYALWPGQIKIYTRKVSIREHKPVNGIRSFEVINPLPVSLDEGIQEIEYFMNKCDKSVYELFLDKVKPDVIHVHTLMGMHKEFVEIAKKKRIRTIYTSHDYFGICPRVNLFRNGEVCSNDNNCLSCVSCNQSALSLKKIVLLQSPMYRRLKDSFLVKILRKRHRNSFFNEKKFKEGETQTNSSISIQRFALQYIQLRNFYLSILKQFDCIHFNSSLAKKIYGKYFQPKNSIVMNPLHAGIADHRKECSWHSSEKIRLTMLAPAKPYKGFDVLVEALDELQDTKHFVLNIFSSVSNPKKYMKIHEKGFKQSELLDIFSNTDVLLAPSIWYETFGFTVLEALSFGVPVIISNHVGAKDIVGEGGIIVQAGSVESLKEALACLTPQRIEQMRNEIYNLPNIFDWNKYVIDNYKLYMKEVNDEN